MKSQDFIDRLLLAVNSKTLYVMGCFGAPMTAANKQRYTKNHSYNMQIERTRKIMSVSEDTFGFDCVNLIKGILWGWCGNTGDTYGGAVYCSQSVPDVTADGLYRLCDFPSQDFTKILPGEMVHMPGHCGVYIAGGLVVESTPKWENGVQITSLGNIDDVVAAHPVRAWVEHGRLPWIDYTVPITEQIEDVPDDWAKEAWKLATAKGITDGTRPRDCITRQEVVTLLHRGGLF